MNPRLPKWFPGREAAYNLGVARAIVTRRLVLRRLDAPPPTEDILRVEELPSTAVLGRSDRTVGELDQDGYVFVTRPEDAALFRTRKERLKKKRYSLTIVVKDGLVCVRKQFKTTKSHGGWTERFWRHTGLPFFFEAAALTLLENEPGVPTLRGVCVQEQTVYMDYVYGDNLRTMAAAKGYGKLDLDVTRECGPNEVPSVSYQDMEAEFGPDFLAERRDEISDLIGAMRSCGVIPLDIKLGNLIVGHRTRRLYWVDFERAYVRGFLNFEAKMAVQEAHLERIFGLSEI